MPTTLGSKLPSMEYIKISTSGVSKLIREIELNKAMRPENFPRIILKELTTQVALVLTVFFEQSFSSGDIPDDYLKKCDRHSPENYTPVSLTKLYYT